MIIIIIIIIIIIMIIIIIIKMCGAVCALATEGEGQIETSRSVVPTFPERWRVWIGLTNN